MKLSFGDVVLARFPYTDLSGDKRRPVVVVSADTTAEDVVVCALTSRPQSGTFDILVEATAANGLRVPSYLQLDKVTTLEQSIIAGRMGALAPELLDEHAQLFFSQFGFSPKR